MFAATDIISTVSRKLYAPAGAEIKIVNTRGEVAICEYNGNRFPCHVSKLTETKPIIEPKPINNEKPKRKSR